MFAFLLGSYFLMAIITAFTAAEAWDSLPGRIGAALMGLLWPIPLTVGFVVKCWAVEE